MRNHYVVIMAGGTGTRFWPFSRTGKPKQFLDILGTGKTMLQQTAERFEGVCPPENIYIVTNEAYKATAWEQLPFLSEEQILTEPCKKNTAPCVAYAVYKIYKQNPEANIVVTPADHLVLKEGVFKQAIRDILDETGKRPILATLGISPTRPDTGYGYIKYLPEGAALKKVEAFVEKPNLEKAESFLKEGGYVWNAGIFVWSAKALIESYKTYLPDLHEAFSGLSPHYFTASEKEETDKVYRACRSISVDYGIMEKAENVYMLPADIGWSDLGTWKSLYEQSEKDGRGNVLRGDIITKETDNCVIMTTGDKLVFVQGLQDYIVSEHENVLLICGKDQEQRIRDFVEEVLEKKGEGFV